MKDEVAGQGVLARAIKVIVRAHIRYAGTAALVVTAGTILAMTRASRKHIRRSSALSIAIRN